AKNMAGVTLCALGDFAANPVIHTIKNFPDDFKQHIAPKEVVEAAPPKKAPPARRAKEAVAGD
ncbi:MAG: NADH-quinone oxidoreductase subunit F, partial [Anaerolineae bacterium]|nr:NADH-quinone oxidoreductase subunit F [Anaerolineae bacterium]